MKFLKIALLILVVVILGVIYYLKSIGGININKLLTTNKVKTTPTLMPTPTPIKYILPYSYFSGIRQTQTPKGEIREIIGKIIRYDKKNGKMQIGDKTIPFVYDINLSTQSAVIVSEVSVDEDGEVVYSKSDESKLVPGQTKIIGRCPEEKIDPACKTVSEVYIITP